MTYATLADLVERFGREEILQLTDRAVANQIDEDVVDRALADADAEIDAHLSARYVLPLVSTPPILGRIACDIARYRLWDDRASEEVRTRYADCVRTLEKLARGDVSLGLPEAPPAQPAGVAWSTPAVRPLRDWQGP